MNRYIYLFCLFIHTTHTAQMSHVDMNKTMFKAVINSKASVLKKLFLETNCRPDIDAFHTEGNYKGMTALMIAAHLNQVEIVKILLENNPQIDLKSTDEANDKKKTALDFSFEGRDEYFSANRINIVKMLLQAGANPNEQDVQGNTILMRYLASNFGNKEPKLIPLLLHAGADVKIKNIDDDTVLTLAAHHGSSDYDYETQMIPYLIDAGAEINAQNKKGYTALIIAAQYNQQAMAKILAAAGADESIKDKRGATLHAYKKQNVPLYFGVDEYIRDGKEERNTYLKNQVSARQILDQYFPAVLSPIIMGYAYGLNPQDLPESSNCTIM